jgi:integrase
VRLGVPGYLPALATPILPFACRLCAPVAARYETSIRTCGRKPSPPCCAPPSTTRTSAARSAPMAAPPSIAPLPRTVQVLTGLRPGELYALEERDVNPVQRTLRVERTLSDDGARVDIPKGGFGRDVDLSSEAVRVLRAHLVRRKEEKLARGWDALPRPLFCSTAGTFADPSGIRAAFRRVCAEAALIDTRPATNGERPTTSARFTPHGLRHTYAALHLQHGTDVYYVSQQLGHADIAMTVGTYGAWLKPNRRATVDALDRTPETAAEAQA